MRSIIITLLLILSVSIVSAQTDSCPALVQEALDQTDAHCTGIGRNQACYGNVQISAVPQSNATDFDFERGGDIVDVADIQNLQLSGMVTPDEWGVALLSVQANLPDTVPGQNVTILLFGDVTIENAGAPQPTLVDVTVTGGMNVRGGPGTSFSVVSSLSANDTVLAEGRNDAGDWVRVQLPDDAGTGWLFVPLITVDGDVNALEVVDTSVTDEAGTTYGPMQSFTFSSGLGGVQCDEAPQDGILIQTPEGVGTIDLLINEVKFTLGSTAYLQAIPNDNMLIALLEGASNLTSQETGAFVPAGTQAIIPLDANGQASAISVVEPLDLDNLNSLPLELLPREIEIAEPLTEEEIANLVSTANSGEYNLVYDFPELRCPWGTNYIYRDSTAVFQFTDGLLQWGSTDFPYTGSGKYSGTMTVNITNDGEVIGNSETEYRFSIVSSELITGTFDSMKNFFDEGECPISNSFTLTYIGPAEESADAGD